MVKFTEQGMQIRYTQTEDTVKQLLFLSAYYYNQFLVWCVVVLTMAAYLILLAVGVFSSISFWHLIWLAACYYLFRLFNAFLVSRRARKLHVERAEIICNFHLSYLTIDSKKVKAYHEQVDYKDIVKVRILGRSIFLTALRNKERFYQMIPKTAFSSADEFKMIQQKLKDLTQKV